MQTTRRSRSFCNPAKRAKDRPPGALGRGARLRTQSAELRLTRFCSLAKVQGPPSRSMPNELLSGEAEVRSY